MQKFLFFGLFVFPLVSFAAGNRNLHCRSESAELVFHTILHGHIAVGDYTVLNGQRADLPSEGQKSVGNLDFLSQGRIFRVENSSADAPLQFKLLTKFYNDEMTLETGLCVEE